MIKQFSYKFDAGPVSSEKELVGDWQFGNCRIAVQLYTFLNSGIFLRPEQVLCPAAYEETGRFVIDSNMVFSFELLTEGDVIYAEKIRNKKGEEVDKSEPVFSSQEKYIISLHTALYTGEKDREIWHATSLEGGSCYWSLEKFLHFYKPVAAKRI